MLGAYLCAEKGEMKTRKKDEIFKFFHDWIEKKQRRKKRESLMYN